MQVPYVLCVKVTVFLCELVLVLNFILLILVMVVDYPSPLLNGNVLPGKVPWIATSPPATIVAPFPPIMKIPLASPLPVACESYTEFPEIARAANPPRGMT